MLSLSIEKQFLKFLYTVSCEVERVLHERERERETDLECEPTPLLLLEYPALQRARTRP